MFSSELKGMLTFSNIRNTSNTNTTTTTTTIATATATAIMPPHDSHICRKDLHFNNNTNNNSLAKDKQSTIEQREFQQQQQQQQKFHIRQQFLHNSYRKNPIPNNHHHNHNHHYHHHHHHHHHHQQQHFHQHQQQQQQLNLYHENAGNNNYNNNYNNSIQQNNYNNENYDNKNRRHYNSNGRHYSSSSNDCNKDYQNHQHHQHSEAVAPFQHNYCQSNQQIISSHNNSLSYKHGHHSDYNYSANISTSNPNKTCNSNPFNKNNNNNNNNINNNNNNNTNNNGSNEFCCNSNSRSNSNDSNSISYNNDNSSNNSRCNNNNSNSNNNNNNDHMMKDMNYIGLNYLPKSTNSNYVSVDCCHQSNGPSIALHKQLSNTSSIVVTPTITKYSAERNPKCKAAFDNSSSVPLSRIQSIPAYSCTADISSTTCVRNYICSPCTKYFATNSVKLPQSSNSLKDFVVVALTTAAANKLTNANNTPIQATPVNAAKKHTQHTGCSGSGSASGSAAASQSGSTKSTNVRKSLTNSGGSIPAVALKNRITKQKKAEQHKKVLINSRSAVLIEASGGSRNVVDLYILKSKNQKNTNNNNNNNNNNSPNCQIETTFEKQQKAFVEDTEMTTTSIGGPIVSVVTTTTAIATANSTTTTTTSCPSSISSAANVQKVALNTNANANGNPKVNTNTKSVTAICNPSGISNSNDKYTTTTITQDKSDTMGHCSQSSKCNTDETGTVHSRSPSETNPIKSNNASDDNKCSSDKATNSNTPSTATPTSTSNSYTLDFLHSVGVQMGAGANLAALKSISTINSNRITSLTAGGSTAALYASHATVTPHSRNNYTMAALASQRQQRYVFAGSGNPHHYQPHYHHPHHPTQLTIASFLQKDLLSETLQATDSCSTNHGMDRYVNHSPTSSHLPHQYSHRYHNYYQPTHYSQQHQQQQQHYHHKLQQHLHSSNTTKNAYNSNSSDKSCSTNTKEKGNMTVCTNFNSRNCNEKQHAPQRQSTSDDYANDGSKSKATTHTSICNINNQDKQTACQDKQPAYTGSSSASSCSSSSISSLSSVSSNVSNRKQTSQENRSNSESTTSKSTSNGQAGNQRHSYRSHRNHHNRHNHNHYYSHNHNQHRHSIGSAGSNTSARQKYYNIIYVNTNERQDNGNSANAASDNATNMKSAKNRTTNLPASKNENQTTVTRLTNKLSESFNGDSSSSSRLNTIDVKQERAKATRNQAQHCYQAQQFCDNTKDVKQSVSNLPTPLVTSASCASSAPSVSCSSPTSSVPCTSSALCSPSAPQSAPIVPPQPPDTQSAPAIAPQIAVTPLAGSMPPPLPSPTSLPEISSSPIASPKTTAISKNLPGYRYSKASIQLEQQSNSTSATGKDYDSDTSSNHSFVISTADPLQYQSLKTLSISSSSSATSSTSCSGTKTQDSNQSGSATVCTAAPTSLLDFTCNVMHYHSPVGQLSYNNGNGSNTYQGDSQQTHFHRNGLMHLVNFQLQSNPANCRNTKFIEEEYLQPHLKQMHTTQPINQFYLHSGVANAVTNLDQQISNENSTLNSTTSLPNHTTMDEGNGYWPANENGSVRYNPTSIGVTPQTTVQNYASLNSTTSPRQKEHDDVQQQHIQVNALPSNCIKQSLNVQNDSHLRKSPVQMSQQQQRLMVHQMQHPLSFPGRSVSNLGSAVRSRSHSRNQSLSNTSNPNTNTNVNQQSTQTTHVYGHQSSVMPIPNIIYNATQIQMRNLSSNSAASTAMHECFAHTPSDRFLARAHLVEIKEPPAALLNNSKWDNLSQSIWKKFSSCQQTEATFKQKMHLWRYLYLFIKNTYPRYGLYLVGSTISGFGADTSDVDMCLVARTSMNIDARIESLFNLTILRDCLIKSGEFENFNLIEAKVPILRFRDRIYQLEVDLNFNNCVGIKNTHLLYCYSQMDWRLRPLVLITKLWAQYHDINNAKNMTISSYSLVLMVIHFLQYAVCPPILPCLHDMYPEKFTLLRSNDFGYVDMNESLGPYESKNHQTLGELFLGFLEYYSAFDYSQFAISVRTGGLLPIHICRTAKALKNDIHQWKELCIEEPFDLTNTARSVYDFETFERVKGVFIASWRALQQNLDLNSIFSPIDMPAPILMNTGAMPPMNKDNFEQYVATKLMLKELTLAAAAAVDNDSNNALASNVLQVGNNTDSSNDDENPSGPTPTPTLCSNGFFVHGSDCCEQTNNACCASANSSNMQPTIQETSNPTKADSNCNLQACMSNTTTNTAALYS